MPPVPHTFLLAAARTNAAESDIITMAAHTLAHMVDVSGTFLSYVISAEILAYAADAAS